MNTTDKKQPKFIKDLDQQYATDTSRNKVRYWLVECPYCEKPYKAQMVQIKGGRSTKCKSCATILSKTTHNQSKTRLHRIWKAMKQRCNNPNHTKYEYYGGRGIKVCDEWENDFISFRDWASENGYEEYLEIDRKDNNNIYAPDNCRWATRTTQMRNTRRLMSTNTSGYRGITYFKNRNKWVAQIRINGKHKNLGYFDDKIDAAKAYDKYVIDNDLEHTTNF